MARARVVVFGYGPLALASLDTLERRGVTPVAVVVPGNRSGPDVDLVVAHARSRTWTLLVQPPRTRLAPFLDLVRQLQPDLFVVWSYSMLLPPELIALARLGAVNVHGGLLPDYRGGHVMNWAIINGERETGVTLAYLDEGIDTGPVIAELRFPIDRSDDAATVRDKLKAAGQSLLETQWPAIEAGLAPACRRTNRGRVTTACGPQTTAGSIGRRPIPPSTIWCGRWWLPGPGHSVRSAIRRLW